MICRHCSTEEPGVKGQRYCIVCQKLCRECWTAETKTPSNHCEPCYKRLHPGTPRPRKSKAETVEASNERPVTLEFSASEPEIMGTCEDVMVSKEPSGTLNWNVCDSCGSPEDLKTYGTDHSLLCTDCRPSDRSSGVGLNTDEVATLQNLLKELYKNKHVYHSLNCNKVTKKVFEEYELNVKIYVCDCKIGEITKLALQEIPDLPVNRK